MPIGPYPEQIKWRELIQTFDGDEQQARVYLATRLREAADQLLLNDYPDVFVFGCDVPLPDQNITGNSFIGRVSVTLSHLWPG